MSLAGPALASTACRIRSDAAPSETGSRAPEFTPPAALLQRQSVATPSILTTLERSYGRSANSNAYPNTDLMPSPKVNLKLLFGGEHPTGQSGHAARRV